MLLAGCNTHQSTLAPFGADAADIRYLFLVMLGGALVIETIFAWPGVGRFAVSAVLNRDFPVMQCFTLLLTTLLVLCNLVVDICYAWLDPRTRFSGVMA